jgi:uncharacterized protein YqjF (DUF2071 family)
LPEALTVEVVDGSAWVGMVLFNTVGTKLLGLVDLPGGASFAETNVRTYVQTRSGRGSVLFLTLEVGNTALARAGRLLGLPYREATMSVTWQRESWVYSSQRGGIGHRVVVRPGEPLPDHQLSDRDGWLTGQWRATLPSGRGRLVVPVEHERWPLHDAQLVELDENLLNAVGLPEPNGQPEVRWSPRVRASVGLPRLTR